MILLVVIAAIVFCFGAGILVGVAGKSAEIAAAEHRGRIDGWQDGYEDCLHGIEWFEGEPS